MVSKTVPTRCLNIWQQLGLYAGVFIVAVVASMFVSGQLFCFVHGGFLCSTSGILLGPVMAFPLTVLVIRRIITGRWLPSRHEKPTIVALIISLVAFAGLFYWLMYY